MLLLRIDELRERRAHGELARVAREDPPEERPREPMRHLVPEPPRDEVADRLVLVPDPGARAG